jgi:hypothetical protein
MPATIELLDRLAEVPSLGNRRDAVRDALASARLEGLALGDAAMQLLDDFAKGRISAADLIEFGAKLDAGA